jgi:hypothetical protein
MRQAFGGCFELTFGPASLDLSHMWPFERRKPHLLSDREGREHAEMATVDYATLLRKGTPSSLKCHQSAHLRHLNASVDEH